MKNPHTLLPATRALLAAFLLAGAGAGITRSAEYTVAPGGSLPSTGVIAASDTITLQGDVAVPASYQLAAKLVLIRSSDPDTPRTITFTSATPTYFFRITSTGVWGFDNIIITGGNSNGTSYGGAITFHHSVAGANTIAGKFTATNNYGILGGGVYTHAAAVDLVFTDTVRFLNNTGRDGGGAVYAKGNLEFKDSAYFEGNYGNGGGAVRLPTNSKSLLLAKNAVFVSNTSPGHAGAILLQGDYYIGGSSTFANNTASGTSNYGGAIFMFTQDNVTATGTLDATLGDITFTGNTHR
ncbi:MAG: hypothetical protein LBC18_16275, partial [Opitutaceae bacterium]|nr:hypothetical protein [Opitutaceae bacterium]